MHSIKQNSTSHCYRGTSWIKIIWLASIDVGYTIHVKIFRGQGPMSTFIFIPFDLWNIKYPNMQCVAEVEIILIQCSMKIRSWAMLDWMHQITVRRAN
jgi:hypothetical protein